MSSNTLLTAVKNRRVPFVFIALTLLAALSLQTGQAQGSSPPAPTNLSGEAVTTGLKISWDAPDTTATITGYEIQRRRGSGDYSVLVDSAASTSTDYTDTSGEGVDFSFVAGRAYDYRVRAIYWTSSSGETRSDPTDAVTVTVPDYLAPTSLTGTDVGKGPLLEWTAPTISWESNRAGISGYLLRIIPPTHSARSASIDSDDTSYHYGASESGSHEFRLSAVYGIFKSEAVTVTVVVAE
ncbi:MAG: fibronectin type III domain-containing protein [Chloroflexi bacterium]|nr:fibronectin type III domain-containing protein [Chloroflexota bacterium]MYD15658.1 fibronectin type III domain-containing protein [Chloroflexota bacterium]MYJ01638.1 fibronectin type III domain-containing protein [Chloroflexota bacterium]